MTDAANEIDDAVWTKVRQAIAESLALSEGEVSLQSRLVDDLGADSLDFVDITFTLGRALDIDIKNSEFSFLTRLDFSSPEVMKDGALTESVVSRLATWLPEIEEIGGAVSPARMFSLISARSICLAVAQQLNRGG